MEVKRRSVGWSASSVWVSKNVFNERVTTYHHGYLGERFKHPRKYDMWIHSFVVQVYERINDVLAESESFIISSERLMSQRVSSEVK